MAGHVQFAKNIRRGDILNYIHYFCIKKNVRRKQCRFDAAIQHRHFLPVRSIMLSPLFTNRQGVSTTYL
ncbi:MAG: hypothetical protein SPI30_08225 [Prevotella sp.]|nr:hypothetical protein [Prevotella sp.]